MIFLGDELTNIGFPIVHVPLILKETIRHICSIEYVHCLLDLIWMNGISQVEKLETHSQKNANLFVVLLVPSQFR